MALAPGQKLANYEILAPLGAGGMGEVWRARDTRLGREVAIKALPEAFARDPERMARFEREAKLLASLNHPNIGAIYGLEVVDGHRYLVLEFLEGESLSAVLSRGPLPVGETIEVCAQVAAALESAHESGIVHRDLKPGNVMVTRTGAVKVLDFGLAKAGPVNESDSGASASPTMTYGATQAGMVLGTAAYMSPEQARGKVVDKRTDIWSFGCLLFECLTARQAFEGETVSDLIAHILTSEPDWNLLPAATPPRVRELLRRCLEKDSRRRLRDMGDARIELEETLAPRGSSSMAVPASVAASIDAAAAKPKKRRVGLELGAAVLGAIAAVLATRLVEPLLGAKKAPAPVVRFEIGESDTMKFIEEGSVAALSPDATTLAFVARDSVGTVRIWVRPLNAAAPRVLPGTEGAQLPFFSPDGRSIAFFTETKLKRVSVASGDVDAIADVKRARGGTWNRKNQILYAPTSDGPLFVVGASGGDARQVTTVDTTRGESGHRFPVFLPDGNHFLYTSLPPIGGKYRIFRTALSGGKPDSVALLPSGVRLVPGWIVFQNTFELFAQRFDGRRIKGEVLPLRESAWTTNYAGSAGVAASHGVMAFREFRPAPSRFAWFDAGGHDLGALPFAPGVFTGDMQFSPDGRQLAYSRDFELETLELWIGDLATGGETRFATEAGINSSPKWSPDGGRIAYMHSLSGPQTLMIRPVHGNEPARAYLEHEVSFKQVDGWTPDGKRLIYERQDAATRWDLWILDVEAGTAKRLLASPFNEQEGRVSPDGRLLAYTSDETGRPELYVQPFETPGRRVQVTTAGLARADWLRDGRLLYQLIADPLTLRTVSVLPGPDLRVGPPQIWGRLPLNVESGAVTPDGRIAVQVPAGKPAPGRMVVITDWTTLLNRR
jgi:Tol biopolymer transport system component